MTLCQRVGTSKSTRFFVADDVFAADDRRRAHARRAARHRRRHRVRADAAGAADAFGVLLQYPGADGDVRDYRALVDAVACERRARRRRDRPARADAARAAGRMGRRCRRRIVAALRRADGLRRAARGLHGDARRVQALAAGTARRRHRRRAGRARVPSRAADARAAHPARKGDVEHLHGAGAAGGDGEHVRRLSRRRGTDDDRAARAPADGDPARGPRAARHRTCNTTSFFDTVDVRDGRRALRRSSRARSTRGVNLRRIDARSARHLARRDDDARRRRALWRVFAGRDAPFTVDEHRRRCRPTRIPPALARDVARSSRIRCSIAIARETEMLRYLRALADKDLALDRSMIPLGSCTMKLNATSEMLPVTWPEFGALHPFAPADQTRRLPRADRRARADAVRGHRLRRGVAAAERRLAGRVRGPADDRRVSREPRRRASRRLPDSGVRARHQSGVGADGRHARRRRRVRRATATSTSPISRRRPTQHARDLAAIMVTYPSTHGVFEAGHRAHLRHRPRARRPGVRRRREPERAGRPRGARPFRRRRVAPEPAQDVLHSARRRRSGCRPGRLQGASRAVPAGTPLPRACRSQHRRGEPVDRRRRAAPYGSASILPISWMYITMMGGDGLARGDARARSSRPTTSRSGSRRTIRCSTAGRGGLVAHECILDLRPLKALAGIEVEDVAKRLIDYGFHAPTMSFPGRRAR